MAKDYIPGVTTVYKDAKREYRWRAVTRSGRIVCDSGEGYRHKSICLSMAKKFGPVGFEIRVEKQKEHHA